MPDSFYPILLTLLIAQKSTSFQKRKYLLLFTETSFILLNIHDFDLVPIVWYTQYKSVSIGLILWRSTFMI